MDVENNTTKEHDLDDHQLKNNQDNQQKCQPLQRDDPHVQRTSAANGCINTISEDITATTDSGTRPIQHSAS
eukprot:249373-Amphidinium_carterae.1